MERLCMSETDKNVEEENAYTLGSSPGSEVPKVVARSRPRRNGGKRLSVPRKFCPSNSSHARVAGSMRGLNRHTAIAFYEALETGRSRVLRCDEEDLLAHRGLARNRGDEVDHSVLGPSDLAPVDRRLDADLWVT